ncbi:MAG: putative Zn-dependent protease [Saprospiraceae bacterium]|jgi:predicted Zn-dependent protease
MKKILPLIFLMVMLFSCTRVPISGRKQMNLLSEQSLIEMSKEQYAEFLSESEVITYGEEVEMVKRVGAKMAKATELFLKQVNALDRVKGFEWEFNLVQNGQLNAWCMPGGKICFYSGILQVTQDETGLAVVMGHEIAHAIARHGNERMSKGGVVNLGGQVLDVAISQQSEAARYLLLNAYGIGTTVGYVLPFSRKHELEADMMGLVFMQLAGYDASKAVDFWKRMSENGASVPEFLSTHPNDETRVQKIREFLESDDFWKYTH